jgi:hypothetical protein
MLMVVQELGWGTSCAALRWQTNWVGKVMVLRSRLIPHLNYQQT